MIASHSTVSLFPFRGVLLSTFPILVALMALPSLRASSNTNTDFGLDAMAGNTQGFYNTAIGLGALDRNTTGSRNTGVGADVLRFNTNGSYNSANGVVRSVLTQPGATTPGTAKLRFIATPPDRITSHWDISRVSFSPSATSILISVTGGSPAKDTPSASVMITRRKLSYQGSTAQRSQACPLWSTILASLGWRLLRRALRTRSSQWIKPAKQSSRLNPSRSTTAKKWTRRGRHSS